MYSSQYPILSNDLYWAGKYAAAPTTPYPSPSEEVHSQVKDVFSVWTRLKWKLKDMAKKETTAEVADKFGVVKRQSEVWVWNDQVYASYKSAVAASKKTLIIKAIVKKVYPTYSASQIDNQVRIWSGNPGAYTLYASHALAAFAEVFAELTTEDQGA